MTRFATGRRVIFWEEPIRLVDLNVPALASRTCTGSGVIVVTPQLPERLTAQAREAALAELLDEMLETHEGDLVRWYCSPTMLPFSRRLSAVCTVYDCMDEYAASPELAKLERELMVAADVVFTGDHSLWAARRDQHPNVHFVGACGIDAALAESSWDETFARVNHEISRAAAMRRRACVDPQAMGCGLAERQLH